MKNAPFFCCFCKKYVLGLNGQEVFLDSFNMDESEEAKLIIKNNLIGYAHWSCLINSEFHKFWLIKFKELFLKETKVKFILNDKDKIFAFDKINNEFLMCDGLRFLIFGSVNSLDEIIQKKGVVYQEHEISLNLCILEIESQLLSKFHKTNYCCLSEFDLSILGYELEFLANVKLILEEPLKDSIFVSKDGFKIFEGMIQYPIVLPNQILNSLLEI